MEYEMYADFDGSIGVLFYLDDHKFDWRFGFIDTDIPYEAAANRLKAIKKGLESMCEENPDFLKYKILGLVEKLKGKAGNQDVIDLNTSKQMRNYNFSGKSSVTRDLPEENLKFRFEMPFLGKENYRLIHEGLKNKESNTVLRQEAKSLLNYAEKLGNQKVEEENEIIAYENKNKLISIDNHPGFERKRTILLGKRKEQLVA